MKSEQLLEETGTEETEATPVASKEVESRREFLRRGLAAGLAAIAGGSMTEEADAGERKKGGGQNVKQGYSREEIEEWLDEFSNMNNAEWEKSKHVLFDKARKSRLAERAALGLLDEEYKIVFPSDLDESSEWTALGRISSANGVQTWLLALRIKKDGRTLRSKFFEFSVSKHCISDKNKLGIAISRMLSNSLRVSTSVVERSCNNAECPLDEIGTMTLEEFVRRKVVKVATKSQ